MIEAPPINIQDTLSDDGGVTPNRV